MHVLMVQNWDQINLGISWFNWKMEPLDSLTSLAFYILCRDFFCYWLLSLWLIENRRLHCIQRIKCSAKYRTGRWMAMLPQHLQCSHLQSETLLWSECSLVLCPVLLPCLVSRRRCILERGCKIIVVWKHQLFYYLLLLNAFWRGGKKK